GTQRLGRRERLDLALVGAHVGLPLADDDRLDLLALAGPGDDPLRYVGQVGHAQAAVPPTVRLVTRSVGVPSPTGTPCPSLPHVPGEPMAKSLPRASIRVRTSG